MREITFIATTDQRYVVKLNNRPGILKITIKPRKLGPFLNGAYSPVEDHLVEILSALNLRALHFTDLENFVRAIFDEPEMSIGQLMKRYFPESPVNKRTIGRIKTDWQNEYITIIEEQK